MIRCLLLVALINVVQAASASGARTIALTEQVLAALPPSSDVTASVSQRYLGHYRGQAVAGHVETAVAGGMPFDTPVVYVLDDAGLTAHWLLTPGKWLADINRCPLVSQLRLMSAQQLASVKLDCLVPLQQ